MPGIENFLRKYKAFGVVGKRGLENRNSMHSIPSIHEASV